MWVTQMGFVYLRINKNGESQKIKVMKTKIEFKQHAIEMLEKRFNEVPDISRMKRVTNENAFKFPVLAQKYRTGIHMNTIYLVSTFHNIALAVVNNTVETVLYLDGSYGY